MSKGLDPAQPREEFLKVEFRQYESGDEKQIIGVLSACHKKYWGSEELWRWKHSRRPGFTKDDVLIATSEKEIVACFHGAILPVALESGLEVPMNVEGDFAVLAEYRKLGIPDEAHDLISRGLLERGVMLRGGFTSRELNERFYHKRFGYIFVPPVTGEFRKILSLRVLQQRVEQLSEDLLREGTLGQVFKGIHLMIDIIIDQFPPAHLEMSEGRLTLLAGSSWAPHMKVQISYSLLVAALRGPGALLQALLLDVIRGRVRVKGLLPNTRQLGKLIIRLVGKRGVI